jgi:hypothetical protein
VMDLFDHNRSRYERFVMQNADYQEQLQNLKHTYKWK